MNIEERTHKLLDELGRIGEIATEERIGYIKWWGIWSYFAVLQKVVKARLDNPTVHYDESWNEVRIQRMEEGIRYLVSIRKNGHAFALFGVYSGILQKLDQLEKKEG